VGILFFKGGDCVRPVTLSGLAIVLCVLVVFLDAAHGVESEPLAFKNYVLGVTTLPEMKEINPDSECAKSDGLIADDECYSRNETIADEYAKGAMFFFYKEKLEHLLIVIDHEKFDRVIGALKRTYGSPTKEKIVTSRDRMGATMRGREYEWKQRGGYILAVEYDRRLDESGIHYRTYRGDKEYEKRRSERIKKRAKDL
jgi:hypothetical protein